MTNETTKNKLIQMRMSAMADAFISQLADSRMKEVSFEDRFGMLVDIEYTQRRNNALNRLIKNADLEKRSASVAEINYDVGRTLNRDLIERLATCEYIRDHRNIFITGATGSGKTFLSCALGAEACRQYYSTKFVRLPDLFIDLADAKERHIYTKTLQKYIKPVLLIIDEWLLMKPTEEEQKLIFEILHHRSENASTIFCSQYSPGEWYDRLGGAANPLTDSILDRIVHSAYTIKIESADPSKDISMREVYGLNKNLRN